MKEGALPPCERFALTLTSIKSYFSRFIYYIKELKLWIIVILILVLWILAI